MVKAITIIKKNQANFPLPTLQAKLNKVSLKKNVVNGKS